MQLLSAARKHWTDYGAILALLYGFQSWSSNCSSKGVNAGFNMRSHARNKKPGKRIEKSGNKVESRKRGYELQLWTECRDLELSLAGCQLEGEKSARVRVMGRKCANIKFSFTNYTGAKVLAEERAVSSLLGILPCVLWNEQEHSGLGCSEKNQILEKLTSFSMN